MPHAKCCWLFFFFFLGQDTEALEVETKRFEDLEFQQLEKESRQDEEKETQMQQLLREIAEYQRSVVSRKVCRWFLTWSVCVCTKSFLLSYFPSVHKNGLHYRRGYLP